MAVTHLKGIEIPDYAGSFHTKIKCITVWITFGNTEGLYMYLPTSMHIWIKAATTNESNNIINQYYLSTV